MKKSTKILVIAHIVVASIIFLISLVILFRLLLCTSPEGYVLTDEFLIQDCSRHFLLKHFLCCLGAVAVMLTGAGMSVLLNGYKSSDTTYRLPWRILAILLTLGAATFLVVYPIHGTMSVFKYPPVINEIPIKDEYYTYDPEAEKRLYYIVHPNGTSGLASPRLYNAAEPGYSVYTASFDGEILGVYNGRIYRLP